MLYVYNDVEWSFYHWDQHENVDSDISIKIGNGKTCSYTTVQLPKKIAKEIENVLIEEQRKETIENIRKQGVMK